MKMHLLSPEANSQRVESRHGPAEPQLRYLDLAQDPHPLTPDVIEEFEHHSALSGLGHLHRKSLPNPQTDTKLIDQVQQLLTRPVTLSTKAVKGSLAKRLAEVLVDRCVPVSAEEGIVRTLIPLTHAATSGLAPQNQAKILEFLREILIYDYKNISLEQKNLLVAAIYHRAKGYWKNAAQQSLTLKAPLSGHGSSNPQAYFHQTTIQTLQTINHLAFDESENARRADGVLACSLGDALEHKIIPGDLVGSAVETLDRAFSRIHPAHPDYSRSAYHVSEAAYGPSGALITDNRLLELAQDPNITPGFRQAIVENYQKRYLRTSKPLQDALNNALSLHELIKLAGTDDRVAPTFAYAIPQEQLVPLMREAQMGHDVLLDWSQTILHDIPRNEEQYFEITADQTGSAELVNQLNRNFERELEAARECTTIAQVLRSFVKAGTARVLSSQSTLER